MRRFVLLFFLLSFLLSLLSADNLIFRNYHASDGLSNGMTTACIQDKQGYIWIGTRDGLNRFNGVTFTVFRNDPDNPASIGADYITGFALDDQENLWVATYKGIYKYSDHDESFEIIPFTENEYTTNLQSDDKGNLWFLMNNSIWMYTIRQNTYTSFQHPSNGLYSSYCIKNNSIWASDSNGILYQISLDVNSYQSYDILSGYTDNKRKSISTISCSSLSPVIYIGTRTGEFIIYNTETHKKERSVLLQDAINNAASIITLLEVDESNIIIGTTRGLFFYSMPDNSYEYTKRDALDKYSLAGITVNSLYKDRESGIWIGCYPGGISYFPPYQLFSVYYQKDKPNSFRGELIRKIVHDKYNNVWIGMQDEGLNCFNSTTQQFFNISVENNNKISQNNIPGLAVTGDTLWIGTAFSGIDILHIPSKRIIKNYSFNHESIRYPNSELVNMYVTRDNQVLVGTNRGIYRYDKATDQFVFYTEIPLQLYRIQCMHEDSEGVLWIGMVNGGIYQYSLKDQKGTYFNYDIVNTYGSRTINDIYEDKDHNLWFATMDGIKKYDRSTKVMTRFRTTEGLPSNVTFCILPDADDNLWISTAKGLVYFIKKIGEFRVYTEANGLVTSQFNYNAGAKTDDGTHYFGTMNGLVSYHPEKIKSIQNNIEIYLTSLRTNTAADESHIIPLFENDKQKKVILKSHQSTFVVNFSIFSYVAPRSTEFSFRLNGGNWSVSQYRPYITLTSLSPGNYNLEIRARSHNGIWSTKTTSLTITILPPWWQSTLAYYIYIILLFCLITIILTFFIKQNEKKIIRNAKLLEAEKEKELYQSKIDFFTNIAHEIRTPLSLIKTPLDSILKKEKVSLTMKKSLNLIEKNTNRLLELVNQLLDFRKAEQENYQLNFINVNIVPVLTNIINDFKHTIEEGHKQLTIDIPVQRLIVSVDLEAIRKIICNLTTNALKYSGNKITVSLTVSDKEDIFFIDFSNNGTAIPREFQEKIFEPFFRNNESGTPGSGLGLPLARSLAEMHNGNLKLTESSDKITTFRLTLPVKQQKVIKFSQEEISVLQTGTENIYEFKEDHPTLLIVEDNKDMLHFIAQELNEHYNIYTAENGKEAMDILGNHTIQLVITDIMMPVVDGLKLLQQIKTSKELSHIPVILLTAKTTSQSKLEGLESKADAYIIKPFDMDILIAQISNLLINRENIREFYFNSPIANLKSNTHSKVDKEFLNKLNQLINNHMSNPELDVNMLAGLMNMSRSVLYRKIKSISNRTPNDLIKITRLKKAAEILQTKDLKIYEVAEMVGFNSQSYFYYSFIKQFGISPSQYAKPEKN